MKFASIEFHTISISPINRCVRFHMQAFRAISMHSWMGALCGESIVSDLEVQVFHYSFIIYENRIEKFRIIMSPPRCYIIIIVIKLYQN